MSGFLLEKYRGISPYVPGEQPKEAGYIKLNTNESPFPPSEKARERYMQAFDKLNLYNDPENGTLTGAIAEEFGLKRENVLVTNGSDEALAFIYMAYAEKGKPFAAPEVSYGFYPVFSRLVGADIVTYPLKEDLSVDAEAFAKCDLNVIFANPNAQTGTFMPISDIEKIARKRSRLVVVDEAYVDFGAESCVPLTARYENVLVVRTFSKSYALAGIRCGYAVGNAALIAGLRRMKDCFNSYPVDAVAQAVCCAAVADKPYYDGVIARVVAERERLRAALCSRGFTVPESRANFLFAGRAKVGARAICEGLKEAGVLVRHWNRPVICDFVRITVGTREQDEALLTALDRILADHSA